MRYETIDVCVDDATIEAGDPWAIIEPVWWSVKIHDGFEEYERSLLPFSRSQRLVVAVFWYRAEVENGGHHQFYYNSTGVVWRDALEAFKVLGAWEFANILQTSANRLGGSPALNRDKRDEQLRTVDGGFKDVDEIFYETEKTVDLDSLTISFIRTRPSDFYFTGKLRRPVLPGMKK